MRILKGNNNSSRLAAYQKLVLSFKEDEGQYTSLSESNQYSNISYYIYNNISLGENPIGQMEYESELSSIPCKKSIFSMK